MECGWSLLSWDGVGKEVEGGLKVNEDELGDDIPTIYLQLKRSHKSPNSSSLTFNPPSPSFPTPSHDNNDHPHSIVTNGNQHTEIHQPIRRSHRLQQRQQQRENSNDQSFWWRLEVPSRKLKTNNYNPENTV